jgi:bifunctional non-homologous end joining protein LigD
VYAGRVGSGITQREMGELAPPRDSRFGRPLELRKVRWARPELVAEVTFLTWTADGLLRLGRISGAARGQARAVTVSRLTRRTRQRGR